MECKTLKSVSTNGNVRIVYHFQILQSEYKPMECVYIVRIVLNYAYCNFSWQFIGSNELSVVKMAQSGFIGNVTPSILKFC